MSSNRCPTCLSEHKNYPALVSPPDHVAKLCDDAWHDSPAMSSEGGRLPESVEQIVSLGGSLESITNDSRCERCHHTSPDHWTGCKFEMIYWKACQLAEELRAAIREAQDEARRQGYEQAMKEARDAKTSG